MSEIAKKEPIAYRLLSRDLQSDRLSQCYLFTGENNPFKMEAAVLFAASVLAGKKEWLSEEDPFFKRVKAGNHFDFHVLSGRENTLKSEEVEALQSELLKTALEEGSGRKVFLIDHINNASVKVYNQLLKFIEETPGDSTFGILLSDCVDSLLPTVVSRCVKIPFRCTAAAMTAERYRADGFEEEEAHFLSFCYPQYLPLDLNDPSYLAAVDLREMTLEYLLQDCAYIPYYLGNSFYPLFKGSDEKSGNIRDAGRMYLQMMILLCKEAFLQEVHPSYADKLEIIRRFGAGELYTLCEEIFELISSNTDSKLLLDRYACRLVGLGRGENVGRE